MTMANRSALTKTQRPRRRLSAADTSPRLPQTGFPRLPLPLPIPYPPMEARSSGEIPTGDQWQYEPKWDGFRCLAFRQDGEVVLQSKSGQPLTKYFPEIVQAFQMVKSRGFVLDGEIIVPLGRGLSFDDLLQRIHPAESRI